MTMTSEIEISLLKRSYPNIAAQNLVAEKRSRFGGANALYSWWKFYIPVNGARVKNKWR